MTALKVIGVLLLIVLLLALTRLGVLVDFGEALCVHLRVGPIRWKIVLGKGKKTEKDKTAEETAKRSEEDGVARRLTKKHALPKLSLSELRDLAEVVLGALGRTLRCVCRRTRIDPLEVGVTFAGDDPADTAQSYGYANAALWAIMPVAEELFCIPHPSITLAVDFDGKETSAAGTVGLSLRLCDLIAILFTLAWPVGKWFWRYRKVRKAATAKPQPEAAAEETKTEQQTA